MTCATRLKKEGKEKAYQFMVRVRIVGGKLTADQYLACDHLAQTLGNGTLRITTRQEFQLHGVLKHDLETTIRKINESCSRPWPPAATSSATCFAARPRSSDGLRGELQSDAFAGRRTVPRERRATGTSGSTARRSKSLPPAGPPLVQPRATTRSSRLRQDLSAPQVQDGVRACRKTIALIFTPTTSGFLAIVEDGGLDGYNVLVGGGLGTTPSAQKTFPFLAVPLCYVDRGRGLGSARRSSRSFAISAIAPTASGPGSSTSFTTGDCRRFGPRSRNTWAPARSIRNRSA